MKKLIHFIIAGSLLLLFLSNFFVYAQIQMIQGTSKLIFNPQSAAKLLDTKPNGRLSDLTDYVYKVQQLQSSAKNCIKETNEQLRLINELLEVTSTDTSLQLPHVS